MKRLLALGAAALLLAACATDDVRMSVGDGLLVAENAATGLNIAAKYSAQQNICHGPCATKARKMLDTVNVSVGTARSLYVAGNTKGAAASLSTANQTTADATRLLSKGE